MRWSRDGASETASLISEAIRVIFKIAAEISVAVSVSTKIPMVVAFRLDNS